MGALGVVVDPPGLIPGFCPSAPDACATHSQERHDNTLRAIEGYCRQRSTEALLAELDGGPKEDPATRAGLPGFNQER